jgi:hypothetical protein
MQLDRVVAAFDFDSTPGCPQILFTKLLISCVRERQLVEASAISRTDRASGK